MAYRNLGDLYGPIENQVEELSKSGWKIARFKKIPLIVAYNDLRDGDSTHFQLKGWYGKARIPNKALSGCYFRTAERRAEKVNTVAANLIYHEELKIARRKERSSVEASDFWTVGDVVEYSWGYDQTNVDFFQVTRVMKKSIEVASISQKSDDCGGPTGGKCQPVRYENLGKRLRKRVGANGHIYFDHGCGVKWDGKPVWTSSYH